MPPVRAAAGAAGSQPLATRCNIWTLVATASALLLTLHQPASLSAQLSPVHESKLTDAKLKNPTGVAPHEHPSMNLIRVDQPLHSSSSSAHLVKPSDQAAEPGAPPEEYMSHTVQQELSEAALEQPEAESDQQSHLPAGYLAEERNSEQFAREVHRAAGDQQQQLERRFGLFKKGGGGGGGNQYGTPLMSGQYSQQPAYSGDCERCFASLSQQQLPPSGDLIQQQLIAEPPQVSQAPISVPIPVPVPIHSYQHQHQHQSGFGGGGLPLKSKFFNKFPFFIKGGSQSQYPGADYEPVSYWPQTSYQHRPSNGALYLRPTAYNCVQAPLPSQFVSGQEMAFKGSPSTGGLGTSNLAATKGGQLKQYQPAQQQATYSSY